MPNRSQALQIEYSGDLNFGSISLAAPPPEKLKNVGVPR